MPASLTFRDKELELNFASHFGWQCRVPTFLLSLVLCLIWTTRLVSAQGKTDVPHIWFVLGVLLAMASMHLFNTIAIYKNPAVCCGEKRKAMVLILDAVCCMVMVMFYSQDTGMNEDVPAPARLIINTPFMVYGIHGWAGLLHIALLLVVLA